MFGHLGHTEFWFAEGIRAPSGVLTELVDWGRRAEEFCGDSCCVCKAVRAMSPFDPQAISLCPSRVTEAILKKRKWVWLSNTNRFTPQVHLKLTILLSTINYREVARQIPFYIVNSSSQYIAGNVGSNTTLEQRSILVFIVYILVDHKNQQRNLCYISAFKVVTERLCQKHILSHSWGIRHGTWPPKWSLHSSERTAQ